MADLDESNKALDSSSGYKLYAEGGQLAEQIFGLCNKAIDSAGGDEHHLADVRISAQEMLMAMKRCLDTRKAVAEFRAVLFNSGAGAA